MEQNNYSRLVELLGNVKENNAITELDNLKVLFKKFIFGDKEITSLHELWFEKEEIKADIEYYQLINSLISAFIKHLSDEKSFKDNSLAKEIISIFKKTKYFCLFNYLVELSYFLELGEQYFTEISCALYILGIKKGTPLNAILIEILKDFTQDEFIENSKFYSQIKSINYETINESFLKNLLCLYKLIKTNGGEEKIKNQIMFLENPEDQSSISTNIENMDNEDKKLNEGIKNFQAISPNKDKQDLNTEDNEKNNNLQGDTSLIIKEKDILETRKLTMDKDKEEIKNKDINDNIHKTKKEIIDSREVEEKTESVDNDKIKSKNPEVVEEINYEIQNEDINKNKVIQKNDDVSVVKNHSNNDEKIPKKEENNGKLESTKSLDNNNNIIQEKEDEINDIHIQNNNIKQTYSDYSLEELLNFIKKKSELFKEDEKDKDKEKNIILNLVLPIFQMHNRFNLIAQQLSICKNTIKEIEASQLSQRIIAEHKIEIEKILVEINVIKSAIELFKTPSIVIVKRKLLDLIIFSLIKSNKDKFQIDKRYCPNQKFLQKILLKIENYSKNVLRKDDIEKINSSTKYINELINKNETIIEFPLSCSDKNLDIIMRYLSFCKAKYNKIAHVSEEALKYFLYLSFNDRIDPRYKELLNTFMKNERNNDKNNSKKSNIKLNSQSIMEEEDKENEQEEEDKNNFKYAKPLRINIDIALEYFLKNNLDLKDASSKLQTKLEELESKKYSLIGQYYSNIYVGWKTLLNMYNKFDKDEQENLMDVFYSSEKEFINDIIKNL